MKSTQFISLLRTLSPDEQADFAKHINRLHSGNKVELDVFKYIMRSAPDFNDDKRLNSLTAAQKLNKGLPGNNRSKVQNALPALRAWLKEYLLFQKANNGSLESQVLWTDILKERSLEAEFRKEAQDILKQVHEGTNTSVMDFLQGLNANLLLYQHSAKQGNQPDGELLQACSHDLDLFYVTMRLKLSCEMANLKNRLAIEMEIGPMEVVVEMAKSPIFKSRPLTFLYLSVFELIGEHKDEQFPMVIELLQEHAKAINAKEIHTILSYLHNYAASQLRLGEDRQLAIVHQLDVFSVANGVFIENGEISHTQFDNIVMVACKAKDFKWASQFVKNHSQYLPADIRSDAELFAKAMIAYGKTDYKGCLDQLQHIEFADFFHAIRTKAQMLRCHYELMDNEVDLENFCVAFDTYLIRNKREHKEVVDAMRNTIGIVKAMYLRKTPKEKLLQAIDAKKHIYLKDWLLEKASSYKSNLLPKESPRAAS
jgi:hypothetical protein